MGGRQSRHGAKESLFETQDAPKSSSQPRSGNGRTSPSAGIVNKDGDTSNNGHKPAHVNGGVHVERFKTVASRLSPRKAVLSADGYNKISDQSPVSGRVHEQDSKDMSPASSQSSLLGEPNDTPILSQCVDGAPGVSGDVIHGVAWRVTDDALCAEMDETWRELEDKDRARVSRSASVHSSGNTSKVVYVNRSSSSVNRTKTQLLQKPSDHRSNKQSASPSIAISRNSSQRGRSPSKKFLGRCFGGGSQVSLESERVVEDEAGEALTGGSNPGSAAKLSAPTSLALREPCQPLITVPLASCESPDDMLASSVEGTPVHRYMSSVRTSTLAMQSTSITEGSCHCEVSSEQVTLCPSNTYTHGDNNSSSVGGSDAVPVVRRPMSLQTHTVNRAANRTLSELQQDGRQLRAMSEIHEPKHQRENDSRHQRAMSEIHEPRHLRENDSCDSRHQRALSEMQHEIRCQRAMSVGSEGDWVTVEGAAYRHMMTELTNMKALLLRLKRYIQEGDGGVASAVSSPCSPLPVALPFPADNSRVAELHAENEELKRTVAQLQAALQQQQQVSLSHPLTTDMAVQVDLVEVSPRMLGGWVRVRHASLDDDAVCQQQEAGTKPRPASCFLPASVNGKSVSHDLVTAATSGYQSEVSSPRDALALPGDVIRAHCIQSENDVCMTNGYTTDPHE